MMVGGLERVKGDGISNKGSKAIAPDEPFIKQLRIVGQGAGRQGPSCAC
jgi:hypothetical protein